MSLSDKRGITTEGILNQKVYIYPEKDVKKFIKEIDELVKNVRKNIIKHNAEPTEQLLFLRVAIKDKAGKDLIE